MYRMEKTEQLIIMSQWLSVPLSGSWDGEREEKDYAGGKRPKRSVSEREERV